MGPSSEDHQGAVRVDLDMVRQALEVDSAEVVAAAGHFLALVVGNHYQALVLPFQVQIVQVVAGSDSASDFVEIQGVVLFCQRNLAVSSDPRPLRYPVQSLWRSGSPAWCLAMDWSEPLCCPCCPLG